MRIAILADIHGNVLALEAVPWPVRLCVTGEDLIGVKKPAKAADTTSPRTSGSALHDIAAS
jgi:hypothetical protein